MTVASLYTVKKITALCGSQAVIFFFPEIYYLIFLHSR